MEALHLEEECSLLEFEKIGREMRWRGRERVRTLLLMPNHTMHMPPPP